MTTSTDVLPAWSAEAGDLAGLGVAGWLGTMSPHTARAYAGDLGQFTAWLANRGIDPEAVTPGVSTAARRPRRGWAAGGHPPPEARRGAVVLPVRRR